MSDPKQPLALPPWVGRTVLGLLVLQLGMLWLQGSMLQRQHEDILGLREDVQAMADLLEQNDDGWDSGDEDGAVSPARLKAHPGHSARRSRLARASWRRPMPMMGFLQEEETADASARKEVQDSRKSGSEAVAKARDTQSKLSLEENARKVEANRKINEEGRRIRPWLWAGAALALAAMMARAWLKRRG